MGKSYTDIAVKSSVENVQNLVQTAFASSGFKVAWENATRGKAEKGSKGMNIAFGALAQYFGIDFEIFPRRTPRPCGSTRRTRAGPAGRSGRCA